MFKYILVPTDLTEKSLNALEVAVKIAGHDLSRVMLLHVIETIEDAEYAEFEDFYAKLKRRALRRMEQILQRYESLELTIGKEISYGKRVKTIVQFAQDTGVDLIVLSSHQIDMGSPAQGWGTISYKVSILSHCPVMLVK